MYEPAGTQCVTQMLECETINTLTSSSKLCNKGLRCEAT